MKVMVVYLPQQQRGTTLQTWNVTSRIPKTSLAAGCESGGGGDSKSIPMITDRQTHCYY